MSKALKSEYMGFPPPTRPAGLHVAGEQAWGVHELRLAVANQPSLANRVPYQDAAEICSRLRPPTHL